MQWRALDRTRSMSTGTGSRQTRRFFQVAARSGSRAPSTCGAEARSHTVRIQYTQMTTFAPGEGRQHHMVTTHGGLFAKPGVRKPSKNAQVRRPVSQASQVRRLFRPFLRGTCTKPCILYDERGGGRGKSSAGDRRRGRDPYSHIPDWAGNILDLTALGAPARVALGGPVMGAIFVRNFTPSRDPE